MKKEKIEFDLDIFVKELSKFNMNFPTKENRSFRTREYKAKSNLAHNVDDNFIYWKAYTGSLNKEEFSELLYNRLMDSEFGWNCNEATTWVLYPFKVEFQIRMKDAEYYEKKIHKLLNKYRVGKEYFELELDKIKDCLQQVSILSEKGQKKVALADLKKKIKIKWRKK